MDQHSMAEVLHYLQLSEEAFKNENRTDMLDKLGWMFIKTDHQNQKEHISRLTGYIKAIIEEKEDPEEKLFHYIDLANLYNKLGDRNQLIYNVKQEMEIAEEDRNVIKALKFPGSKNTK